VVTTPIHAGGTIRVEQMIKMENTTKPVVAAHARNTWTLIAETLLTEKFSFHLRAILSTFTSFLC
jgi:hypothetical protein